MQRGSSLNHRKGLAEPLARGSIYRSREGTTLSSKPLYQERGSLTIVHLPDKCLAVVSLCMMTMKKCLTKIGAM
jgi:hypothetical protein